jgi:hypothetical protein
MRIKTSLLPVALGLLVAGCNKHDTTQAAGGAGSSPGTTTTAARKGAPFPAEVVAVETDGTGVTLRDLVVGPNGVKEQRAVRVDPTTAATIAALKPGDRVKVVCDEPANAAAPTGAARTSTAALQSCGIVVEAAADTAR